MNSLAKNWATSPLGRSLHVLNRADQQKLLAITLIQILMGVLDLLGVIAIGLLGALSVSGLQSLKPGNRVSAALDVLQIADKTFQTQAIILGLSAVILLVGKTVLSIYFTRRILFFLSHKGSKISYELVSRLLSKPLISIQERTSMETLYAVTSGVVIVTIQILATGVVLIADVSLLIIMGIGLVVADPITAVASFLVFALTGFFLYRLMHVRAGALGVRNSELIIKSNEKIVEVFAAYRELLVQNRRDFYAREIGKMRDELAKTSAEISFMPYVSKYVIETTIVLGAILVGGVQFVMQDTTHAVATVAIFLAAGSRVAPAVLRVQQGLMQLRGSLGQATPTLDLIETLGDCAIDEIVKDSLELVHEGFVSEILATNVSLTYPNKVLPAVSNISLKIAAGTSVALVGPSGAGKTTIIDLLLGVLTPDQGNVLISGLPPLATFAKWPGSVSYVPQDVMVMAGSIRENVALGYPNIAATDELILSALKVAHLDQFVSELPQGLDTLVGERGAFLSGGQRQRLGIARAMFTRPLLLVLDEATSSLDGETEEVISDAIHQLRGSTTVVMIAHRLSSVRNADLVVYMETGKILATGTFEEVRRAIPDFDRQAKLMGL